MPLDRMRVRLLVRNLLDNALRYSADAASGRRACRCGRCSTAGSRASSWRCATSAPAWTPAQLAQLTEPFYRTDGARQRATGGVGLGMYLCRLVAEAHGGECAARLSCGSTGGQYVAEVNHAVRAVHHDRGVPAHDAAHARLELAIARIRGLVLGTHGVDVVGVERKNRLYPVTTSALEDPREQKARAVPPFVVNDCVERIEPLARLLGVAVGIGREGVHLRCLSELGGRRGPVVGS